MIRTYEAVIDPSGSVRIIEPVALPALHRALVILFEDEAEPTVLETAMIRESSLAEEWDTPEEDVVWAHLAQLPSL